MDADAMSSFSAASRRRNPRLEAFLGFEEAEESDEERADLPCPFCAEEFDLVGLCCHVEDDHPIESKAGVCPICDDRVGLDLVGHFTTQHASFFKRRRKNRRGSYGSHSSTAASTRKDLSDGSVQSFLGGSSRGTSLSTVPDPLLSSFISSFTVVGLSTDEQEELLDKRDEESNCLEQKAAERSEPLCPEDIEERTRRSQFVQGLVLSTIFDDIL